MKNCILLLFICFYNINAQQKEFLPSKTPDRIILTWSDDPHTTQSVTWRTDVSVTNALAQIAKADGSPDFTKKLTSVEAKTELLVNDHIPENYIVAKYHSVTFKNLTPSTKYAYRVGDGEHWSEWFHFTTGGKKDDPISFLYFGDAQNDVKSMWSRVVREAYSTMPKVDFLIHAGDLINNASNDWEWGEWFHAAGWINAMIPNVATPGNHEYYYYTPKIKGVNRDKKLSPYWKSIFTFPKNGPGKFDELEETTYFIDYQDLRIISINSSAVNYHKETLKIQTEWLEHILKNNPQKWTIVTQHFPLYNAKKSRSNIELRNALQPLYEKYKVDLVLQGHDHSYARGTNKQYGTQHKGDKGPIYVVSVSGPKMYESGFSDWVDRTASNTQLYQLIKIEKNQLRYESYTATGELYDAFELNKTKKGYNKFLEKAPKNVKENISLPGHRTKNWSQKDSLEYQTRFERFKERKKNK